MGLVKKVLAKIDELGTAEASKFFGVSAGTIANWKSGKSKPSIEAAELCLGFGEPPTTKDEDDFFTDWEGKDLLILIPAYQYMNPKTHFSLFANYAKYGPEKIGILYKQRTLIGEARSVLINKAMQGKANNFLFVDNDMVLPFGNEGVFNGRYRAGVKPETARLNAISRIMSHPEDKGIVGGLYYGRNEYGVPQCGQGFRNKDNSDFRKGKYSGLMETEFVGTGFMLIRRWVIEKMKEAIDSGKWPECKPIKEGSHYGYFTHPTGQGEDLSFCLRAAQIGIKTYVDTDLVCLHEGDMLFGPRTTKDKPQ